MNKKKIFLISIVVIGVIIISFPQYFGQIIPSIKDFLPFTKTELEKISDVFVQQDNEYMENLIERYGSFLNEKSLVNLIHIVKEGSNYEISCQLGSAYEIVDLHRFFPEGLVALGQIKNCDIETAKAIDQAIISDDIQCLVLLSSDMSAFEKNDYYLVTLLLEQKEITQEIVDGYHGKGKCARPFLGNFIGEMMSSVFTAIVDLNGNYIYY